MDTNSPSWANCTSRSPDSRYASPSLHFAPPKTHMVYQSIGNGAVYTENVNGVNTYGCMVCVPSPLHAALPKLISSPPFFRSRFPANSTMWDLAGHDYALQVGCTQKNNYYENPDASSSFTVMSNAFTGTPYLKAPETKTPLICAERQPGHLQLWADVGRLLRPAGVRGHQCHGSQRD